MFFRSLIDGNFTKNLVLITLDFFVLVFPTNGLACDSVL